jgi:nicotinamidase-related amidase
MSKILIVVDMQNDFINGALGSKEAEVIVSNVVKKISEFNGDIYVTLDTHDNNYLKTQEGVNLSVKHCISGTYGHELNSLINTEILKKDSSFRYRKPTFGSTELAEDLSYKNIHENEIEEIELVGLCTDICVISNALLLKAFMPEVKIKVDASCCAGVTPQSHKNALEAMKMCQIKIINE